MSRDFYRNRCKLGSIQQFPSIPSTLQKLLSFDSLSDVTDNFDQLRGSNASQSISNGVLQFRNGTNDYENAIRTKFTINKIVSLYMRIYWQTGGSSVNYCPQHFDLKVLDASNTVVTTFRLEIDFAYNYSESAWYYWNRGYVYWQLGTDAITQSAAEAKRLTTAPSRSAYHTYEFVDIGGGYIDFKIDGTKVGSSMYLGNATYKLGGPLYFHALNGWYNASIICDIDTFNLTYL